MINYVLLVELAHVRCRLCCQGKLLTPMKTNTGDGKMLMEYDKGKVKVVCVCPA